MNYLILFYINKMMRTCLLIFALIFFVSSNGLGVENHSHDDHESKNEKIILKDHGDEHEEGSHDEYIKLSNIEINEFDIKIGTVGSGNIEETLTLSGEITVNPDQMIHIVPRVSGVTRNVFKSLGDKVNEGELLATLSSRELAESKAELSAAKSRYNLSVITFNRERNLKNEGITSEREFLEAQQGRDNAYIEYNLAKQKLQAIGIEREDYNIEKCDGECDLTLYEIRSPADGIITEKHVVHGELLNEESRPFVIANLDQVWVNLTVYQKDLDKVHIGQKVQFISGFGIPSLESKIVYISPIVSEETRSATARVLINNKDKNWRPGLFVSVLVTLSSVNSDLVIPRTALETINDQTVIFVKTEEGFKPHPVTLGRGDKNNVEVLEGLHAGDKYVAKNAFVLKAQMQKASFGDGHGH